MPFFVILAQNNEKEKTKISQMVKNTFKKLLIFTGKNGQNRVFGYKIEKKNQKGI